MKTKLFTLLVAALLVSSISFATIRRVGFFGTPLANVDYATFALANTAASAGDTILVFPGPDVSGDIAKKLIIIGTGNWLDPNSTPKGNANQQAFGGSSTATQIMFKTGSQGSVIMGFDFGGSTVYVGSNDITIRRNRNLIVNTAYNPNASANIGITVNNLQLLENYKLRMNYSYNSGFTQTNLNISNNLMEGLALGVGNSYSGNISNNIWAYDGTLNSGTPPINGGSTTYSSPSSLDLANGAFLFQNNILYSLSNSSAAASNTNYFTINNANNTVFNYNLALQTNNNTTWGSGTGNVITSISNYNLIFEGFPAIGTRSADDRYILKAGSPALAANRPGSTVDAGIFAGSTPYKLSTIPSIPTIYQLSSPQGNNPTGTTIQINLSTKGNN